jgi:hypothetical protein
MKIEPLLVIDGRAGPVALSRRTPVRFGHEELAGKSIRIPTRAQALWLSSNDVPSSH